MFFFFFDLDESTIIKKCMEVYLNDKMGTNGYCDVAELFSDNIRKNDIKSSFNIYSEELVKLYSHNYPKSSNDLHTVYRLYSNKINDYIDGQEAFAILFWCFKIFKSKMKFEKHTEKIMDCFIEYLHNELKEISYSSYNTVVYCTDKIEIHIIKNVSDLLTTLDDLPEQKDLYYRGHSKASYKLSPSILRNDNLVKNENHIYQELLINCPNDFKNATHHIDYLVKMQHYGLPTRLLDITKNPLVALYFSCCSNPKNSGEIIVFSPQKSSVKYENSDTVAMLSSLPLFSFEDQGELMDYLYIGKGNEEIVNRFIHEVKTEKPGFVNRIRNYDMDNCFVVLPKKDNNRIVKQDGAFIICGINYHPEKKINENLRLIHDNKMVLLLVTNKQKILEELDLLSINKSTLFPEIDSVSEYIKSKYND